MGFFEKFKAGFRKHTPTFHKATVSLFGGKRLSQGDIDDLEEALYGADFGVETSEEILEEIQRANALAEVSLCDAQGFVLVSASQRLERGELNTFWELDRTAVDLALSGFPASSRLYQSGALSQGDVGPDAAQVPHEPRRQRRPHVLKLLIEIFGLVLVWFGLVLVWFGGWSSLALAKTSSSWLEARKAGMGLSRRSLFD